MMARVLIMAIDKPHTSDYKIGDIVEVRPDSMGWGRKETLPRFWRIEVPGETPNDIDWLTEIEWDEPDQPDHAPPMKRRRKRFFQLNKIPQPRRVEIGMVGITTLTLSQFENAITEKN